MFIDIYLFDMFDTCVENILFKVHIKKLVLRQCIFINCIEIRSDIYSKW